MSTWAPADPGWLVAALLAWAALWALNVALVRRDAPRALPPLLFGLAVLALWEGAVRAWEVPAVILPPPTAIAAAIPVHAGTLWADFLQTFAKGALGGYVIGCSAALLTAVLIDRSPFLTRGLLPVGNFVAALPIVGIAPILVMWFGFDWQSKAAVVVVLVFFPVLVNTVAGLQAAERMQRDLMATWGASWAQAMWKLRLPAAMPFVFNGLKIATTLALIGAIVAEYFGSPIVGMGFRISTGVGRLQLDLVWAEIAVAALAGSVFYGLVAAVERRVTFWHPSQRA
jgi:NitT/TauT family transport system permease protein